jgi:hypothetical protein
VAWIVQKTVSAQGALLNSVYADSIFWYLSSSLEMLLLAVSLFLAKRILTNADGHFEFFSYRRTKNHACSGTGLVLELIEERGINFVNGDGFYAESMFCEHIY